MTTLYWNNETDTVETMEDLRRDYGLFAEEYQSFDDFVSACQWYNNGALEPLYKHISKLENELEKYSDYYDDSEKESIRNEIETLKRMYLET